VSVPGGRGARGAAALAVALAVVACAGGDPDEDVSGRSTAPAGPVARHAVLVTVDTVRADRIGAYGREDAGTPWMDALAARGTRFERAYAHVPITLPSHVSILTGLLPTRTGVHVNGQTGASPETRFLAEILAARGFLTAAAVGGFPLDARYPVSRGFERYDDRFVDRRNPAALERRATDVVEAALRQVEDSAGRRVFLWVHLFDPHDPYEPPEPFASRYADDPYQGEIAFVDAALARLAAALEPVMPASETLWTVVGDHGEALGEHGEPTHGFFVYEPTVRVPWIVAGPGDRSARVVPGPVGTVDVAPTILACLGVPVPDGLDGRARPLLARDDDPDTAVYVESELPSRNYGWAPLRSAIGPRFKFIEAPRAELYDLREDPGETFNQIAEWPDEAATLRERLAATSGRAADDAATVPDPRLASLGYVGTSAGGRAGGEDPKDHVATYVAFQEASRALEAAPPRPAEAIARLDSLVAAADSGAVRLKRAMARRMLSDFDGAMRDLEAAGKLSPDDPEVALERGRVRVLTGRDADAIPDLSDYVKLRPESPEAWLLLGAAQEHLGRRDGAEDAYRRALALNPGYRDASLRLAALFFRAERFADARAVLSRHLAIHPGDPLAAGLLSEIP